MSCKVYLGDCRDVLKILEKGSVDIVVTSPPYWGLRDYKTKPIIFDGLSGCKHNWDIETKSGDMKFRGKNSIVGNYANPEIWSGNNKGHFCSLCGAWRGQVGLEPTPELYLKHLLDFFSDIKLKLKAKGNCFVNLGDTYWGGKGKNGYELPNEAIERKSKGQTIQNFYNVPWYMEMRPNNGKHDVIKTKSLYMIPERFAWGMIERGWILRNKNVWYKPNHMPESVKDRLTKSYEFIYHFVKRGNTTITLMR